MHEGAWRVTDGDIGLDLSSPQEFNSGFIRHNFHLETTFVSGGFSNKAGSSSPDLTLNGERNGLLIFHCVFLPSGCLSSSGINKRVNITLLLSRLLNALPLINPITQLGPASRPSLLKRPGVSHLARSMELECCSMICGQIT